MAKKELNKAVKTITCTGCGVGKFLVPVDTKTKFCHICFTVLGNNNRYKAGLPMYKPTPITVGSTYPAIDGYTYKILKRSYKLHNHVFYTCKRITGKRSKDQEYYLLGDYFFSTLESKDEKTN